MNANDRRVLYCEALAYLHKGLLEGEKTEELREKLNDISRAFAKTLKVLTKKKITVKQAQPEMFTKKQWKSLMKKGGAEVSEDDSDEEEEKETEEAEDEQDDEED